jgi:hypothetical protein
MSNFKTPAWFLFFSFFLVFSTLEGKTFSKKVHDFLTDPLVVKFSSKMDPTTIIKEKPKKQPEIVLSQADVTPNKPENEISYETIKTCFNSGVPVSYKLGNETIQACVCPLHTRDHHCGYSRAHLCTNKLLYPSKKCEFPQG